LRHRCRDDQRLRCLDDQRLRCLDDQRLCRLDVRRGFASPQPFKSKWGYAPRSALWPKAGHSPNRGRSPVLGGHRPARQSLASHRGGIAADSPFGRALPCISQRGGKAAENHLASHRGGIAADSPFARALPCISQRGGIAADSPFARPLATSAAKPLRTHLLCKATLKCLICS